MELYKYDGPVMLFDRMINPRWKGETRAPSVKKAKSNLTYQFKREHKLLAGSKIELPGKISGGENGY